MEENIEESTSTKKGISPKTRKILNIAVDIFCGIILIFALIIAISTITSRAKGYDQYTEIFGRAYLAVESDSMKGDKEDNFSKGDLIVIKTLSESEIKKLKVNDVITFLSNRISDDGKMVLNTHRIVEVRGEEGNATSFITKGDNNPVNDPGFVIASDVVGVFQGKAGGIGNFVMFLGSTGGFITFVLVPTLIIVAIAAVNLILVIKRERKEQTAAAADAKIAEREQMRAELMAEMGLSPDTPVIPSVAEESPAPENTDSAVEESPAPENTDSAVEESPDNTVIPSVAEESPAPEEKPEQSAAEKSPAKPKPATKSAAKPTTKSAAKPTTKTTTKSAAKPTTKTTTKSAAKPTTAKPKSDKK